MIELGIDDLINNYLKFQKNINSCSDLTIKAYSLDLKQAFQSKIKQKKVLINLPEKFSITELWEFTLQSLNQWNRLSSASKNRKIATLKSFFRWLYESEITDSDYSNKISCPSVAKKIPHFISVDEAISVLKAIEKELKNETYSLKYQQQLKMQKVLFLLLYGSGLRISEACQLLWKNTHLTERKILVTGKGGQERICILPDFCADHLKVYQAEQRQNLHHCEFIFGNKALNPRVGYEMIRSLGSLAQLLHPLHPHALRHSFATHLLTSGANLRTLQTLLGHQSLQATEKYTHLNLDHLSRTIESTHPLSNIKSKLKLIS